MKFVNYLAKYFGYCTLAQVLLYLLERVTNIDIDPVESLGLSVFLALAIALILAGDLDGKD